MCIPNGVETHRHVCVSLCGAAQAAASAGGTSTSLSEWNEGCQAGE